MQKSPLQYSKIIFQSKVIPLFLPKCSQVLSFENVYYRSQYHYRFLRPRLGSSLKAPHQSFRSTSCTKKRKTPTVNSNKPPYRGLFGSGGLFVKMGFGRGGLFGRGGYSGVGAYSIIYGTVYLIMVETVDFLPYIYMVETVGKKNGKTWRNEVDTKTVKISMGESL